MWDLKKTRIKLFDNMNKSPQIIEKLEKFKIEGNLNLLNDALKSFNEIEENRRENAESEKEINELIKKYELPTFGNPIEYYFEIPLSMIFWHKEYKYQINELPYISIHFIKDKKKNNRLIYISLNEKCKNMIMWGIELEIDKFWDIEYDPWHFVGSKNKLYKIGKIQLNKKIENCRSEVLKVWLLTFSTDDNINRQIKEKQNLLAQKIIQGLGETKNLEYENISDEERKDCKDKDDIENKKLEEMIKKIKSNKQLI